jgi:DNA-binding beta-propeller fold protein YncE
MAAVGELVQSTTGQWMAGPPFTGLADPAGVAVDTAGNVYVADFHKRRVLKLAAGQRIAKPPHRAGIPHATMARTYPAAGITLGRPPKPPARQWVLQHSSTTNHKHPPPMSARPPTSQTNAQRSIALPHTTSNFGHRRHAGGPSHRLLFSRRQST